MSAPVTRGQLKTRALQRADFPINASAAYIDQSPGGELEQLVDSKLKRLYQLLTEAGEGYNISGPQYLSTIANTAEYNLPQDFMNLDAIYYVVNNGYNQNQRVPLRRFNEHQQGQRGAFSNWGPPPISYRLLGRRIRFEPVPTQSLSNIIEFFYIQDYTPPATDNVPLTDFVKAGWEEYIVDSVAWELRIKEGLGEEGALAARVQMFEAKIQAEAAERDRFSPSRMRYTGWQESDGEFSGAGDGYFGFYGAW